MASFFPKVPGQDTKAKGGTLATGVWNRNLRKDNNAFQLIPKAQALLHDKIRHWGIRCRLWQEPQPTGIPNPRDMRPGSGICSCVVQESQQPDNKCLTCNGTAKIGGYREFGYNYIVAASISSETVLFTNTVLNTEVKPNRVLLAPGVKEGFVETSDFVINNIHVYPLEYHLDRFLREDGTSVDFEYSLDKGVTWKGSWQLSQEFIGAGTIRFRIKLARASASSKSPAFEVLRLRHKTIATPEIKILKGMPGVKLSRTAYGLTLETAGQKWWTMPLQFFDSSIAANSADDRIEQASFVEFLEGALSGVRFKLVDQEYSDPQGVFVTQRFNVRRLQPQEIEYQVF